MRLGVCILAGLLFTATRIHPETAAPNVVFLGHEYAYDEAFAIRQAEKFMGMLIRSASETHDAGKSSSEWYSPAVSLGWTIVAIGEFSEGSEAVDKLFQRVKREFGKTVVLFWVADYERWLRILAMSSFTRKNGGEAIPEIAGEHQIFLFTLVEEAEKKISARTGYKFTPHRGPAIAPA